MATLVDGSVLRTARPGWECVCGAVPLGSTKHAGVTRRVAGERDDWWYHVICLLSSVYGQTMWRNYVRYVAFARPWWEVCLCGAVPLGSAKHAGVNAACRW